MVFFQIPSTFIPGLKSLLTCSPEQVESMAGFLKNMEVGTGPQRFALRFEEHFKDKPGYDRNLAIPIYGLGGFKLNQRENLSNEEIAEGIANSFAHQYSKESISEGQIKTLSDNVLTLLYACARLNLTFKAFSLQSENESVFRENHIVTDIRPLFNEELKDMPRHGIIIHHLKVNAEENGQQNDYYFSLTMRDLQKLQEQITRAIEKEKLLRQDYQDNIGFITISE